MANQAEIKHLLCIWAKHSNIGIEIEILSFKTYGKRKEYNENRSE
jgi:hypothetical protein